MANPLIFKTNGNFYNVIYISKIFKVGDTQLKFLMTNNMTYTESYSSSDSRDNVYNDFIDTFVEDADS